MIFASLTMLCLLCAPTLAQSTSPSASQYEPGTCPPEPSPCTTSSAVDSLDGAVDNAAQGTDAVNGAMDDAMEGPAASVPASAPTEAVVSSETVVPSETASSPQDASSPGPVAVQGSAAAGGGSGSITRLPETGGASLAVLGWGVALAALGLVARKVVPR